MRGCVHIYCGDGKGKTSSAVGLAVRASGRGKKVLIVRFLKTEDSGEVLRKIPGITVTPCDRTFGFVFRMNEEQKREAGAYFQSRFETAVKTAVEDGVDLLVLDEILASCNYGMVREDDVAEFLRNRPAEMEVVLTGRDPSDRLIALADYVSEIKMVKHPYTQGIGAREGIEY